MVHKRIAGGQPGEGAAVAFPGSSKLLLAIGVQASGQGHRTVYRRLVADYLGIPAEIIEVAHGDSDDEVPSAAAVASRSTMSVGGAIATALDAVIENGKRLAAHLLETAEADIQYLAALSEADFVSSTSTARSAVVISPEAARAHNRYHGNKAPTISLNSWASRE